MPLNDQPLEPETTVSLIVTGKTEEAALADSLSRIFPGVRFQTRPRVDGFTAGLLPEQRSTDAERRRADGTVRERYADRLARRIVGEAFPGRHGVAPDLVLAIDDLELANIHQPQVVVNHLAESVREHIEAAFPSLNTRDRAYAAVRAKCSFHLFVPMLESYFYAEPAALDRAGRVHVSRFDPTQIDLESFDVDDVDYLAPPNTKDKHDWRRSDRRRHPKRYVKYLSDLSRNGNWKYNETEFGAAALRQLAWAEVLAIETSARFARSLFEDLAHGLGRVPPGSGNAAEVTWQPGRQSILRNV